MNHKQELVVSNIFDSFYTCSSWVAVALCSGFFTRHFFTKSVNSSLHSSGLRKVGGGFVGIIKIAWWHKKTKQDTITNQFLVKTAHQGLLSMIHSLSLDECLHKGAFLRPFLWMRCRETRYLPHSCSRSPGLLQGPSRRVFL